MLKNIIRRKIGLVIALVSITIGFTGLVYSSYKTYAANLNAGPLTISYAGDQLFNESNIKPGDVIVKDLSVKNNGTLPHSFSMSASNVTGNLASVLQIEPRENGLVFWNETLANLASLPNGSKVVIGSIDPGATRNLQIAAIFPGSAGNDYQDKSVVNFSFSFGNESTDTPEGNPSPPPGITFGQRVLSAITYNPPAAGTTGDQGVTGQPGTTGGETVAGAESGARGATTEAKSLCFWWLVILIILIVSLVLYHRYIKEEKPAFWWIWPIVMATLLFFIHYYFDRNYQKTIFCQYFWAVEAVVLIIYYLLEATVFNKPSEE